MILVKNAELWSLTFFESKNILSPCSLSELETDIKMFKDSLLKILDEDELIDELCLTKWSDPQLL